jgi:hypothetical protein
MSRSRLGYLSPSGQFTPDPSPQFLHERLFEARERYTARNRGAAWLAHHSWIDGDRGGEWLRVADRPALVLFAHRPHEEFCRTGRRSGQIRWANVDALAAVGFGMG